ncbi:insulinase family protein [bacterium]|nr:insulinase family protein [candidate division CSSED10-310 bacterium]
MTADKINPNCVPGQMIRHFEVLRRQSVDTVRCVFHELIHRPTGARYVHLSSEDDNNTFMVLVRTIPTDSTGVAHILEHSVLEGSRRFPVRAYRNLTGRSLNSFLNAMTSADYTAYPLASRNRKDFFNLLNVYLDAVFFPLLRKETFLQEGWRYEFDNPRDGQTPLRFKGVVYNEMKGAVGNPLRQFFENVKRSLFPDLTYRFVSGGDPMAIPDLTYEQWKAFHAAHYHPSNAFFMTYGNIPIEEIIDVLEDSTLSHFKRIDPPEPLPLQKPYREPRTFRFTYPVSKIDETDGKSFVAVLWKLLPQRECYPNLQLALLNLILTGDTSSILNRKLLASGLGGGLAPVSFDRSFSETIFGIGLKDTDEEKTDRIVSLILETLDELTGTGIPGAEVEAALHQLEFFTKEIKGDRGIPFGLHLFMRGLEIWLNGGDFLKALSVSDYLERLRGETLNPEFLPSLIRKHLLDNPHRATMIMVPEQGGIERQEQIVRNRLESVRSRFDETEIERIIGQSEHLKAHQDREEDTSCIPSINLTDISPDPEVVPCESDAIESIPIYTSPVPTNGIDYLTAEFDVDFQTVKPNLPMALISLVTDLGAAGQTYADTGRLIRKTVGDISYKLLPYRNLKTGRLHLANLLSARCIPRNHAGMLKLCGDLLLDADFSDVNRISELIGMKKAYAVPTATFSGHRMAGLASARWISPLNHYMHQMEGLGLIQWLLDFRKEDAGPIAESMQSLLKHTTLKNRLSIGCTGLPEDIADLKAKLPTLISRIPENTGDSDLPAYSPDSVSPVQEAWIINTEVSYVARSIPVVPYNHPDSPVLRVIAQLMERPLYMRIRAGGGAYGAFSTYSPELAVFSMMTYRDPHTAQSLDQYKAVIEELGSGRFTDEHVKQAIIETIRIIDIPPSPREKGLNAFLDRLRNHTLEMKKRHREGILGTTRNDICRVMDTYFTRPMIHGIAIVTSDDILNRDETAALNLERISLLKS